MRRTLFAIVFLFLICGSALATNYYARPSAQGSGNGSDWTNAMALSAADSSAVYRSHTIYFSGESYGSLDFEASGGTDEGERITVKRATVKDHGTETGWNPDWDAQADFNRLGISADYYTIDGSDAVDYGIYIISPNDGDPSSNYNIDINSANFTVLSSVYSHAGNFANRNRCLYLESVENSTISHLRLTDGGLDAIALRSVDTVVFDDIWIDGRNSCCGEHGDAWEFQVAGANITFKNSVWDYDGQQLFFGGVSAPTYDNFLMYGIVQMGGSTSGKCTKSHEDATVTNLKIYNSTCVNMNTNSYSVSGTFINNIFYDVPNPVGTHTYTYYETGMTVSGTNNQAGGDPFVDEPGEDFHLAFATDAGSDLGSPYNVDMDGVTRTNWDRGAYEYDAGGAPSIIKKIMTFFRRLRG